MKKIISIIIILLSPVITYYLMKMYSNLASEYYVLFISHEISIIIATLIYLKYDKEGKKLK